MLETSELAFGSQSTYIPTCNTLRGTLIPVAKGPSNKTLINESQNNMV